MRWKNKNKAKASMDIERETDNNTKKPSVSHNFFFIQFLVLNEVDDNITLLKGKK